MNCLEI